MQLLRFLHHRLWLLEQLKVEHARYVDSGGREDRELEIRPNSRVMEIMTDRDGHVSGVKYLDHNGRMYEQPARFVIVGTYVFENTRLLLLSKSKAHPKGLSNHHGQVGKGYIAQVTTGVNGVLPGKELNVWAGTASQAIVMDDFNGDNFVTRVWISFAAPAFRPGATRCRLGRRSTFRPRSVCGALRTNSGCMRMRAR